MALIAMAVHDTEENGRSEFTEKTLSCLSDTIDCYKHRIIIINNGSSDIAGKNIYEKVRGYFLGASKTISIINLPENIGTAKAINLAWKERKPGEHCIKMDNDVVINQSGWVEEMEAAIEREPQIGIVGLKRKDLWQFPGHADPQYKSELIMLPHEPGENWIVAEKTRDIMGTCVMHSSALLDKVGYLYQPSLYGYDDVLMSYRSNIAGFINVFLPHIDIDHIDPGGTDYSTWKHQESGRVTQEVINIVRGYLHEGKSIYYEP